MSDGTPRSADEYDGMPNPNYDPEYGKRGKDKSAFARTLRLDVDDEKLCGIEAAGLTVENAGDQLAEYLRNANINDGLRLTAESITVIQTGQVLKNFQATVAAIFEIDDVVHVKLNTGDVVEIQFYHD